jgi:uncharacterized protein (TIGR03118 family)
VANTSTGVATFYDKHGNPSPLVVTIPAAPGEPLGPIGSPTGLAYNPTSDFVISAHGRSAPARFLFDTLDGLICGWNPDVDRTHAIIMVDNSTEAPFPASYTGLALARNSRGKNVLYAADSGLGPDTSNNRIDMFNGRFRSLGSFTDQRVAAQYPGNTAFQVEDVNDQLYVTFGGFTEPFGGVVDVFDTDGHLLTPRHFAANTGGHGPLINPWGIVEAPAHFGPFSHDILIGNVEDGRINAFDPRTGTFRGTLRRPDGTPIEIPGLWDLAFGDGSSRHGRTNEHFFTAGANAADFFGNGLFGKITPSDGGASPHVASPEGDSVDPADTLALFVLGQENASNASGVVYAGPQARTAMLATSGAAAEVDALAAHTVGQVQPMQPASAPAPLVTKAVHARVLDQQFTELDGSTFSGARRVGAAPAWAV